MFSNRRYHLHIFIAFTISAQCPLCHLPRTIHTLFLAVSAVRQQISWYPLQIAEAVCHQIPYAWSGIWPYVFYCDWARLTGLSCNRQIMYWHKEMQGQSCLTPASQTITSPSAFWHGLLSSEDCRGLYVGDKERTYRKPWRISLLFLEGSTVNLWSPPHRNRACFPTGRMNMFQLKPREEQLLRRSTK